MNRRAVALMSAAHVVDDLYQGVVPALLPFLVVERHYTYEAVSGLTLAAAVLSSVAQPAFGWWTDRRPSPWMISLGMVVAAAGVAVAGQSSNYLLTWAAVAVSGLGIAAFHPEAARTARQAAGSNNRAMSVFVLGGNAGFALGSLVATPLLLLVGLRGTLLLAVPAIVMAIVLLTRLQPILLSPSGRLGHAALPTGPDDWPGFLRLTSVVVVRSILFFGLTSFLALYFINELGTSRGQGGEALTVFLAAGACGTLLGGAVADRYGRLLAIRAGFAMAIPSLLGLVLSTSPIAALVFVILSGVAVFLPFSMFVVLGQDYLPHRIGTASGVTVGLGVSVGGLCSPLLGALADATSLRRMLTALIAFPVLALLLSVLMRDPANRPSAPTTSSISDPIDVTLTS